MSKFEDLSLLEKTQKLSAFQLKMTNLGTPVSVDGALKLLHAGYDEGSKELGVLGAGLTDIDELVNVKQSNTELTKETTPEVKPLLSWSELTAYDRQVRIDQLDRFYKQNYPTQTVSNDFIIQEAQGYYNQEIRRIADARSREVDNFNLTEVTQQYRQDAAERQQRQLRQTLE
jgi:hypothetical protein